MSCHVVMLIPHALLRIDRAPPSSVSLLFCAFALCILRKYLQTNAQIQKPQRLSNFFKTWVIKDFLRIIWVNIGRIFVGKLGENCQSSLVFCGYDDWRSDKAENYTRRGTGAPASNYKTYKWQKMAVQVRYIFCFYHYRLSGRSSELQQSASISVLGLTKR